MEGELVFPLQCSVQTYAWGRIGSQSEVANLKSHSDSAFELKEDAPYAELWMGTHPNGPSRVCTASGMEISLEDWIKQNPSKLGKDVNEYFKGALPFLFKVLSVNTALSVQAHPNKVHAEKLHAEKPDIYKDPNHKPEMAIALTPFKGLCGFRPIKEIANFLQHIEELRCVVGPAKAVKLITASKSSDMPLQREALKDCFTGLMTQDKEVVMKELEKLMHRLKELEMTDTSVTAYERDVLFKLNSEFPGDVGCFTVYFLNAIVLQPGEAMFLEANLPHAYLSGDCMECMACSDNVVRAGLTPKFRDVHTLCEMLDYTCRAPAKTKFKGQTSKDGSITVTSFKPPIYDFAVKKFEVPEKCPMLKLPALPSASICIVVQGSGRLSNHTLKSPMDVTRGTVFFVAAEEDAVIEISSGPMLLFQAFAGL